jgi:hypothetical protein
MPIVTRQEVEDDIALKITDKTELDKVDNVEDGSNRNLILDYTDTLTPYRFWRAEVNFNSVIRVIHDGIGFTSPTVSNPSNGNVIFTKTGFFTGIDVNKIDFISDNLYNSGQIYVTKAFQGGTFGEDPNNKVLLRIYDMAGAQTGTPSGSCVLEIRIYN